ncbi:MAG TPA: DMT family transporter [Methylomirabilota bacterium]|nr:DMT family transporter [Methylomirabilota bacterium]
MAGVAPREDRLTLGLAAMAIGVVFFTCIDTSAKWLMLAGVAPLQVVFARYAGHLFTAIVLFLPSEGLGVFRSARPGVQAARSLALALSTLFNFMALATLPITVTTTIMFAGPIVVTLLAIPMLGEVVGVHRIAAVFVGFVGVLVVMQPWGAEFDPAMLLVLCALLSSSLYFILTRKLAGIERNSTSQVWSSAVPVFVLGPYVLPIWTWPDRPLDIGVMAAIGLFGAFGHILVTWAHRLADASILAPVIYIQIVLAAFAGIVVFGAWPTTSTLAGGLIIVAAGLYIWHRERLRGRPPARTGPV